MGEGAGDVVGEMEVSVVVVWGLGDIEVIFEGGKFGKEGGFFFFTRQRQFNTKKCTKRRNPRLVREK